MVPIYVLRVTMLYCFPIGIDTSLGTKVENLNESMKEGITGDFFFSLEYRFKEIGSSLNEIVDLGLMNNM